MAEVVGGAFLSAFVQILFDSLASQEVLDLFREKKQIANLLEKLEITLWSANALLNDADDKQIHDRNVKSWIDKLSEVLSEADDLLDRINSEALRCKVEGRLESRGSMVNILMKFNPTSFNSFDREVKPKIENVIDRLKFLLKQKDFLRLNEGVQSRLLERSPAPLIQDPQDVYGRDEDREAIVELLLSDTVGGDNISVISIVGMGGIGKTTLTRLIYNDSRVQNHFNLKAWIVVSDDFYVFRLAKLVLEGLTSHKWDEEELDQLRVKLEDALRGKKFLIVLDDVWNEDYEHWDALRSYFQFGADGSKIIVTTRNEHVASKMGSIPPHHLKAMSDGDCWELFRKHAFHNVEPGAYQDLEEVGKEIVKKCRGLPLAAKSLAGLLRSVSDPKEWKKILKSDVWESQRKGNNKILPSLWLSYSYLPSHLKRCFAYCSIFPKDYEYEKEKIILLWMAEGLLQGESMEDVGEEYFQALISRSLLQRSNKANESIVVMHDLVHDLAMFVLGKGFCIRLSNDRDLNSLTDKTRHLLFEKQLFNGEKVDLSKAKRLRTFLALPLAVFSYAPRLDLTKLYGALLTVEGCLRVLSLYGSSVTEVPESIGNLKHLRYFDLSGTRIKRLPNTICILYNLQTLLLIFCTRLTHLPENIEGLINLRHLDISNTSSLKMMPLNICNLKGLQTLTRFVLGDKQSGSRIKELRELPHLRGKIQLAGLENVVNVEDVLDAGFQEKCLITELILNWFGGSNDSQKERAILDALKPHRNLRKLRIGGFGGTMLSDWVADDSFSHITEVYLSYCKHCCILPPLGQLPSLKELKICGFDSIEIIDSEFYGSATTTVPFKSLESLCLEEMQEWRCWSFNRGNDSDAGPFPCLKKLRLGDCPNLESPLPYCLPSLKILEIVQCQRMDALLPSGRHMNTAFPSLKSIDITDCAKLEFSGWPLPSSLNYLSLSKCGKLFAHLIQWDLQRLTSLKHLSIKGCNDAIDSFPQEGLLPTTLTSLCIAKVSNLKAISGKGFRQLSALEELTISYCSELRCLLEEALPASLSSLYVCGCPLLERRLQRGTGEDWDKISHIPRIYLRAKRI